MREGVLIQSAHIIGWPLPAAIPEKMKNALRRADEFIQLSVFAGARAFESLPLSSINPDDIGVFLGTTTGPLETNFRFLDTLFDDGEGQCSPTLFSHSVHNAAAGYLARLLNIQGPALTMTSYAWPFLLALSEAKTALEKQDVKVALVLGVEEESPVLMGASERLMPEAARDVLNSKKGAAKGAVAWLLVNRRCGQISPKGCLRNIFIEEKHCDPSFFLNRDGEIVTPAIKQSSNPYPGALISALVLSKTVVENCSIDEQVLSWSVEAPCGKAAVIIDF